MQWASDFTYSFHVQIFFLISGYLSFRGANSAQYQVERAVSLYYAYLLWAGLSLLTVIAAPSEATAGYGLKDLMLVPVRPPYHFWFLPALIVTTAIFYFARSTFAILAMATAGIVASGFGYDWLQIGYFFPFAAIGALLRKHEVLPKPNLWQGLLAAAMLLVETYFVSRAGLSPKLVYLIPFALAGCYALYVLSDVLDRSPLARPLAFLGTASLAIYLTHGFFATAARMVVPRVIGANLPYLVWAICTVIAIVGPVVFLLVAQRLGADQLVGFKTMRVPLRRSQAART